MESTIFTIVVLPLFAATICGVGMMIGMRRRIERSAKIEKYKNSPESRILRLNDRQ